VFGDDDDDEVDELAVFLDEDINEFGWIDDNLETGRACNMDGQMQHFIDIPRSHIQRFGNRPPHSRHIYHFLFSDFKKFKDLAARLVIHVLAWQTFAALSED